MRFDGTPDLFQVRSRCRRCACCQFHVRSGRGWHSVSRIGGQLLLRWDRHRWQCLRKQSLVSPIETVFWSWLGRRNRLCSQIRNRDGREPVPINGSCCHRCDVGNNVRRDIRRGAAPVYVRH